MEKEIADFLGAEACILYSQGFATVSSVITAFCKRGDVIVADKGVSFSIQKGIQISRSTVKWFEHNNLRSLEDALISVEKDRKRRRGPLTRRFIITEGIFERDGVMVDLPKLVSRTRFSPQSSPDPCPFTRLSSRININTAWCLMKPSLLAQSAARDVV